MQTHISWVFLTGRYAYKVKKPVKLPFVDFSALKLRKRFCDEELRVNRRLASDLYLGVVPIGGTPAAPRIGRKPPFEYAVKMREFPPGARLDRRLEANRVPRAAIAEFAENLAEFHGDLKPVRGIVAAEIGATAARNIDELAALLNSSREGEALALLSAWTKRQRAHCAGARTARRGGRSPRMPRRPALAELALARRQDHGVRRTGVRPQAA